jgi:CheY-like chemotaxis protein
MATGDSTSKHGRILVVDPDRETRAFYHRALEDAGHDIVDAEDGRDALVKALVHPPRLVIMDVSLPVMDGYTLCGILRKDRDTCEVPILVVTSEPAFDRMEEARAAGADSVLAKPAELAAILAETRRLIDGRNGVPPARDANEITNGTSDSQPKDVASSYRRSTKSRVHERFNTSSPPSAPPELICPMCDEMLTYQYSHVGGVNDHHSEQWDHYVCPDRCGVFEYRQRTRKIRRVKDTILPPLR